MDRVDQNVKKIYGRIPEKFKIAFISAMIVGLIAHMYMFTNKLPNMDDLVGVDNFGVTFKNGRWFLWILGAAAYHLNLVFSMPWLNGLITLCLLACSAGIVAILLNMKGNAANAILGAAMVTFPSWVSTFFYMFTAPYYAFAVLMAVLSVYMTVKYKKGFWISTPLLACSMGIYQAYLPFTATLYVVLLFLLFFENDKTYVDIIKKSVYYLVNIIAGVCVYFVFMKFSLWIAHQSLNTYKGLDSMGKFSLSRIPEIGKNIFVNFFGIFLNNNLEISYNLITKGMYLALFIVTGILVSRLIYHLCKKADYVKAVAAVVLLVTYVIAINSIYIMCADGIYSLMYYAYVFMMIFPLALLDRSFSERESDRKNCFLEWIAVFALVCGIGSYCQYASAQYLSIQLSYEQAKSYFTTLITQIKCVEGYTDETKIAFVGDEIQDKTLYRNEIMHRLAMTGRDETLVEAYSFEYFLRYYCGFKGEYTGTENLPQKEIAKMPSYPSDGSIQMIDDVIVVKFAE